MNTTLASVFSSILMAGFVGDMGLAQKMATQNDHLRVGPGYPILILIDIVCQVKHPELTSTPLDFCFQAVPSGKLT